jgi:hypothetical protein
MNVLRVDTPADLRRASASFADGFSGLIWVTGLAMTAGIITFVIQLAGRVPIGAAICLVWVTAWGSALRWGLVKRRQIARWRQPIRIAPQRIYDAHTAYWKLTPETRTAYGLPLIEALYRLSVLDVKGTEATHRVHAAMYNRVYALNDLVDAEDKLRLYAVDPTLADNDDLTAAAAFQQAIEAAEQQIRTDNVL